MCYCCVLRPNRLKLSAAITVDEVMRCYSLQAAAASECDGEFLHNGMHVCQALLFMFFALMTKRHLKEIDSVHFSQQTSLQWW